MAKLMQHVHSDPIPRDSRLVLVQVGWLGATGEVYPLNDQPMDDREPGSFTPLYIAIGVWENLGDGKYGIKD